MNRRVGVSMYCCPQSLCLYFEISEHRRLNEYRQVPEPSGTQLSVRASASAVLNQRASSTCSRCFFLPPVSISCSLIPPIIILSVDASAPSFYFVLSHSTNYNPFCRREGGGDPVHYLHYKSTGVARPLLNLRIVAKYAFSEEEGGDSSAGRIVHFRYSRDLLHGRGSLLCRSSCLASTLRL